MKRSLVYKNTTTNNAPSAFGLTSPADASTQNTALIFGWQPSSDPDNNPITYTLQISRDNTFATIDYQLPEISDANTVIGSKAGLINKEPHYYWRVIAIDQYGGQKYSTQTWSFSTDNSNGLPAIVTGYVRNDSTGTPITNATYKLGTAAATSVMPNGAFLQMASTTGTTTLTLQATGYSEKTVNLTLSPGTVVSNNVYLTATGDTTPPENGVCGTSDKGTFSITPTTSLCSTGTPSTPTGSGPWYWTCDGTNGGATASCVAYRDTSSVTPITPKAKVFLGADDNFTVSTSGTTFYGNTGNNEVTIASGATGVILDQNIERINFSDAAGNYTFKQTGNMINVYNAAGTTLVVKAPVQGDSDGTILSFSDWKASTLLVGGVMTIGGTSVNATAASVTPASTLNIEPSTTNGKAKVFLNAEDNFTVSNNETILYGNSGKGTVTIAAGTTGVTLDQNIGQINLSGAKSSYTFRQTGNIINVYDQAGSMLIVKAPVQGDADGTVISFNNGTAPASAKLSGGEMTLGGVEVQR